MRAFLYTADFALKGLLRRKTRNLSITCLFGLIVFLFSGIDFMSNALYQETLRALEYQPALIVQNVRAGRQVPVGTDLVPKIENIFGVARVRGRVWGYYFDPYTGANYTVMGDPGDLMASWNLVLQPAGSAATDSDVGLKPGEAFVGQGILKARSTRVGSSLNFLDCASLPFRLMIRGCFSSAVSLWTHDLMVLTERDTRVLFGLSPDLAWDLAVDVPNELEVAKVGEKIVAMAPGTRVIAANQLRRTYGSSYGFRSGVFMSVGIVCLLAFLILAYDRVAGLSQEEQEEIAILKAVGWQTRDVIRLNMLQSLILALTGFLAGILISYYHVFVAGAPILRLVFSGWSVLYPPHPLPPALDLSKLFGLMFVTVVPYVAVSIVPVWRVAVRDPEEVFRA